MKKNLFLVIILFLIGCSKDNENVIPVVYPVTVDALEEIGNGAAEVLEKDNYQIKEYSAEGDATKFPVVVDAALANNSEVVIAVGTQITNTILSGKYANKRSKIVAAAIYEPEKISIPDNQVITIISDNPSKGKNAVRFMIKGMLGEVNKVGILQNNGEINSVESARLVADVLLEDKVQIEYGYVSSSADITPVVKNLLRKGVELIVIPHDKIAVGNASAVVRLGLNNQPKAVPVFSLDDGTVAKDGVLFAVSADYEAIGKIAAAEAIMSINNNDYKSSVIYPENIKLVVNKKVADKINCDYSPLISNTNKDYKVVLIDE